MLFKGQISSKFFRHWFLKDRENKLLLRSAGIIIIIQFIIFKWIYPYPNFMPPDSNAYMEAAAYNQLINMWAIGYSKFLRLFSTFTNSHVVLVSFQYLLLETCILYFLFSVRYLLSPAKWIFRLLIICCILNPLVPHISNFVSSDSLFAALSLVWFTQLFWIIARPRRNLLIIHSLILLLAFMVRYNAVYYPLFSITAIAFTNLSKRIKVLGIGLILALLGLFIGSTEHEYRAKTGTAQFAAFGGWQIAANALYGYAHAMPDDPSSMPARFRDLHMIVNQHMDSIRLLAVRPDQDVAIYYLWDFKSPLKIFLGKLFLKDTITPYFHQWASVAPLYADYGRYLIWRHPGPFLQYYVWPNFIKYYAPPPGFMGFYNLGNRDVDPIAKFWFGWKNNRIYNRFRDKNIEITFIFPILLAVINLVFVISFISFVILDGFGRCTTDSKRILWWILIVWFSNMAFSVLAAPIELRYQIFPMIITFVFLSLFVSFLMEESKTPRNQISPNKEKIESLNEINIQFT